MMIEGLDQAALIVQSVLLLSLGIVSLVAAHMIQSYLGECIHIQGQ